MPWIITWFLYRFCTVWLEFLDFSRNRLAVHPLPPGGTSGLLCCSYFGMIRLAAMNFCQVVRHCSCSILVVFDAICMGIIMGSEIDLYSFYWIPCWSKINWNSGYGKVLGILVHELNRVIQEGTDREAYMNWIKGRKLVNYICIVISRWI